MGSPEDLPESSGKDFTPLKVKGTVVIAMQRCKGCSFCVAFCPTEALTMSHQMNAKGYHYPELTYPERCNGCDLCGMLCPDFALYGYFEKRNRDSGK